MSVYVSVAEDKIDAATEQRQFTGSLWCAGAVVAFTGIVRPGNASDPVQALELQDYPGVTGRGIEQTARQVFDRWQLESVRIAHRTGRIAVGETIVLVLTASLHRRSAFEAADALMDYLKTEALFWKREWRSRGSEWIEPRKEDFADARRWANNVTAADGGVINVRHS